MTVPAPPRPPVLSAREREVLSLSADGLSVDGMASALWLSRNTIKTHLRKVYAKLGVTRRSDAVAVATRLGLLGDGCPTCGREAA